MESGVLTVENFPVLLRGISQKRRQGVLEITQGEKVARIVFVQGKVVELVHDNLAPAQELALRFREAEIIPPGEDRREESYRDLFLALQRARPGAVSEPTFKRAVKHRIIDCLLRLKLDSGAYYEFSMQMVNYEREYAPLLSVGQILLDMVDFQNVAGEFKSQFPECAVISPRGAEEGGLSEDEKTICSALGDGLDLARLRARSLLSCYSFESSMLSLSRRGVISVVDAIGKSAADVPDSRRLVDSAEMSIDRIFSEDNGPPEIDSDDQGRVGENNLPPLELQAAPQAEQLSCSEGCDEALNSFKSSSGSRGLLSALLFLFMVLSAALPLLYWSRIFRSFAG